MDLAELGALADRYNRVRADRLAADKVAAKLKSEEERLKQTLAQEMRESDLSSVGGKQAIVKRQVKVRPIAQNWEEIWSYIFANEAVDLLQKRLLESGVKARWEDNVEVPGIGSMEYDHLTLSRAPE